MFIEEVKSDYPKKYNYFDTNLFGVRLLAYQIRNEFLELRANKKNRNLVKMIEQLIFITDELVYENEKRKTKYGKKSGGL